MSKRVYVYVYDMFLVKNLNTKTKEKKKTAYLNNSFNEKYNLKNLFLVSTSNCIVIQFFLYTDNIFNKRIQ